MGGEVIQGPWGSSEDEARVDFSDLPQEFHVKVGKIRSHLYNQSYVFDPEYLEKIKKDTVEKLTDTEVVNKIEVSSVEDWDEYPYYYVALIMEFEKRLRRPKSRGNK